MVDHTNRSIPQALQSQEGLLHDVDPSLTEANEVAKRWMWIPTPA